MNDEELIKSIARQITEDAQIFNEAEEHQTDKKYVIKTSRQVAPIWKNARSLKRKINSLRPYADSFMHYHYDDPAKTLRVAPYELGQEGGYMNRAQFQQMLQRFQQELEALQHRTQIESDIKTIYADHCRYARSPLSGIRYLIVGIDKKARGETYAVKKTDKDLSKHWTYKLRDFFYSSHQKDWLDQVFDIKISRRFDKIYTIKAENILSVEKLYEDEE